MIYILSVSIYIIMCIIMISVFYISIKRQEKRFKQYMHEEIIKTGNHINNTTKDITTPILDSVDSNCKK